MARAKRVLLLSAFCLALAVSLPMVMAEWSNSTWGGYYPINSSMTVNFPFAINDTGIIGAQTTVWTVNASNLYLYCAVEGCSSGFAVGNDTEEVPWYREDTGAGHNPSEVHTRLTNVSNVYNFGNSLIDMSGNGLDGVVDAGAVAYNDSSPFGTSIQFDGNDEIGVEFDIVGGGNNVSNGWSLEMVFYIDDSVTAGTERFLASYSNDDNTAGFDIVHRDNPRVIRFDIRDGGASGRVVTDANQINTGIWYHYVAMYDGTKFKHYLNGTLQADDYTAGAIAFYGYNPIIGGRAKANAGARWVGQIDYYRLYERVLSETEIQRGFENLLSSSTMSNLGAWIDDAPPPPPSPTNITLLVDGIEANGTITYEGDVNLTAYINETGVPVVLTANNLNESATTRIETIGNQTDFANGTYLVNASWVGNSSYAGSSRSFYLHVNKKTMSLSQTVYENAIQVNNNTRAYANIRTNVRCGGNDPHALNINGVQVNSTDDGTLLYYGYFGNGTHNFTCYQTDTQNYTLYDGSGARTHFAWITKSSAYPTLLINGTANNLTISNNSAVNITVNMTGKMSWDVGTLTSNYTGWVDVTNNTYNFTEPTGGNAYIFNITPNLYTSSYPYFINITAYMPAQNFTNYSISRFITIDGITKASHYYESPVLSGASQTMNVTWINGLDTGDIVGDLVYNNTVYKNTSVSVNASHTTLEYTFNTPVIGVDNTTKYFYFNASFGATSNQTSETLNQNITRAGVVTCSASSTRAYNFTIQMEDNSTLAPSYVEYFATVYTDIGATAYNVSLGSVSEFSICISPAWGSFDMDLDLIYYNSSLTSRNYYMVNATTDNVTDLITIYQHNNNEVEDIIIKVKDESDTPLEDAIVYAQKLYWGNETYNTVAMVKTDFEGEGITHLETSDTWYRFVVYYAGSTYTFSPKQLYYDSTVGYVTVNLVVTSSGAMDSYKDYDYSCSFNETTSVLSCSYAGVQGTHTQVCLDVYNYTYGQPSLYERKCDTDVSATLTITLLPNTTMDYYYKFYLHSDSESMEWGFLRTIATESRQTVFLGFLGVIVVGALMFMTLYRPSMVVISTVLGIIITGVVSLNDLGMASIMGVLILGGVIINRIRK